jgi:hypothetical protein
MLSVPVGLQSRMMGRHSAKLPNSTEREYLYGFDFVVGNVILWEAVPSLAAAEKS